MDKFKVDDWVLHRRKGHRGSVLEVTDSYIEVQWLLYASGRPLLESVAQRECCLRSELLEYPDEPRVYSYDELVIAFMTEDKDWYYEVLARKGANQ